MARKVVKLKFPIGTRVIATCSCCRGKQGVILSYTNASGNYETDMHEKDSYYLESDLASLDEYLKNLLTL